VNWRHIIDLLHGEMASGIVVNSLVRLILAAIFGGVIGLQRELKHKPAGLRTNMFICFGAALFTVLSRALAETPSDSTRIAAQIIPGIGFIGAGSILHMRGLTTGLTTAATLFVVASIGMAVGGGLYLTATFATGVIVICLFLLGKTEQILNLKLLMNTYEVTGKNADEITAEVNRILESNHSMMKNVQVADTKEHVRVQFELAGKRKEQEKILRALQQSSLLESVTPLGPVEPE